MYGPNPSHQATGIFTPEARRILAETALAHAYRHDDASIGTGHLLLATLDQRDPVVERIVGTGVMGSGPVNDHLARTLVRALPGDEHPTGRVSDGGVISFDLLIRILSRWFGELLPPGWSVRGSGRSDGIRISIPESRFEQDYAIHMGWIVTSEQPGRDRLIAVANATLVALQEAVTDATSSNWPTRAVTDEPAEPHAEIAGDDINPTLRLYYGPSHSPVVERTPILLNSVLYEQA